MNHESDTLSKHKRLRLTVWLVLALISCDSAVWINADQAVATPTRAISRTGAAFTDDPLVEGSTPVRKVHVTELRARIDGSRVRFGLLGYAFTDPNLVEGTTIKAQHIVDLRTALAEAYAAGSRVAPIYTDPDLQPGASIKAIHIAELRSAVVSIESPPYCVITTMDLSVGNAIVTLNGCGAGVGGNLVGTNPSATITGTPTPPVDVVGTCSGTCSAMGALTTGAPPPGDPLAGLVAPPNPGGCVAGVANTLSPGCYSFIANSVTTLNPGIYFVTGTVNISNLTGSNVMIFLAEPAARLHSGNNNSLTLTAPTSGPYAGIAIFQEHSNINNFDVGNNFSASVSGAIYMPGADLDFFSSVSFTNTDCTVLIARSVTIGNGAVVLGHDGCSQYGGAMFLPHTTK